MPAIVKLDGKKMTIPRVIIVRGAPGVGKTTIAKKVCSLHKHNKKAYLPIDDLQHFDSRNSSRDKLKLGIYHAVLLTRSFVREGFDVIVDYVFDRDIDFFVEKIFRSHATHTAPCVVQPFFLDVTLEKALARNADRDNPMPRPTLEKLYKVCEKEKSSLLGEVVIDTTPRTESAKKIAKQIISEKSALCDFDKTCEITP